MDSYKIISDLEKKHIEALVKKGQRIDGRGMTEFRDVKLEADFIPKAEGSARVFLGKTEIIAGVKVSVGTPYPDTPNSGVITVNAELSPMGAPHFEAGPPDENSVEVARVVDRGIRHSDIVDKEKLVLVPGEQVFIIFVDLYVLAYDGNLFDAGELAAVRALCDTKLPKFEVVDGKAKLIPEWAPLEIMDYPVSVTTVKIGDALLVDPNENEERVLDSRMTLALNAKNEIVSAQKGGKGSFTVDEVAQIIEMSQETAPKLRELLKD